MKRSSSRIKAYWYKAQLKKNRMKLRDVERKTGRNGGTVKEKQHEMEGH
jgi:hypothetical protein